MASIFLKSNADKTEVLVIGFRTQLAKFDLSFMKLADADVAVQSNPIRNLGVAFDSGMTMAAQVCNIVKFANFHLINIGWTSRLLTDDTTKLAIHTFVKSRLDYCNSLLIGIRLRLQRKLQNIQRTSARLITIHRKFDSITSQLIELHWLPIKQRIDNKVLMLLYKALHNQAPPDITNVIQVNVERRRLRSSCSIFLFEPRTCCVTFGDRAFSTYGPRIWNKLPAYIKNSQFETFKMLLKTQPFIRKRISNFLCLSAPLNISLWFWRYISDIYWY